MMGTGVLQGLQLASQSKQQEDSKFSTVLREVRTVE